VCLHSASLLQSVTRRMTGLEHLTTEGTEARVPRKRRVLYNGAMPAPVIATKLFIPPSRPNAVPRSHLIARLNEGLHRRLTLISAPAGFGKTSLASAWVRGCGRPAARLSLDNGDNDPTRFLTYLVAALQTIAPTMGAGVAGLLQSPQPPPVEALLPMLLNELATMAQPAVLVLDDYHLLDARPIDAALTVLLEHLPPQLHLVIATREDPPLPLARLRASGQLTELRASDLRFTASEAAAFLTEVMGFKLSAEDIATLGTRTEGWIAGLQLAALSMQGHQDVPAFIRAFAGDHGYIVDYLVEEVLQRQPEQVRSFLLQTAILDRLSGSLCDAITGQQGGSRRLETLFADGAARSARDAASARERVVRAARFASRCYPPRPGREGFQPGGGSGRVGPVGDAQQPAGGGGTRLASGHSRRGAALPARAQRSVCLVAPGCRRARWR
jgi:hypothetical protein